MWVEFLGWIGALLLAFCALPEALISLKTGDSSLSYPFLFMWYFGEILACIYTVVKSKQVRLLPLMFNYGLNIVFISIILACKMF